MNKWGQHRQLLLALTFVGVFFTLGRFSLDSAAGNRQVSAFAFPSVVPLPGWQLLESRPLAEPSRPDSYEVVLASQKYRYRQNKQHLEIEMRYEVGSLGNFRGYYSKDDTSQSQNTLRLQKLHQQEGVGFYSLFVHQGRSHLIACINPRGGSTFTSDQFLANRNTYDLQLQRLVPWFLGKESLIDRRCLWVDMSTPLNQASAETTYPVLEKAWQSWYQWWSQRFPKY